MRARAVLTVELDAGRRSVVRELRSQAPLSLVPRRGTAAAHDEAVTVHIVGSACTPLAGDEVELDVRVGPGASLVLTGVAAAVALPGAGRSSSAHLRFAVAAGASLQYLPEPTVVTARADHRIRLDVELHPTARLRVREVLVAGRTGEPGGRYRGTVRITEVTGSGAPAGSAGPRPGPCSRSGGVGRPDAVPQPGGVGQAGAVSRPGDLSPVTASPAVGSPGSPGPGVASSGTAGPGVADPGISSPTAAGPSTSGPIAASRPSSPARVLLVQTQELGDPALHASAAHLARHRVLATEVLVWGDDPREAVPGEWWSLLPLARRGSLATAVAPDAVTAQRELARAVAAHPGWSAEVLGGVPADLPRTGDSPEEGRGLPSPEPGWDTRQVEVSQPTRAPAPELAEPDTPTRVFPCSDPPGAGLAAPAAPTRGRHDPGSPDTPNPTTQEAGSPCSAARLPGRMVLARSESTVPPPETQ